MTNTERPYVTSVTSRGVEKTLTVSDGRRIRIHRYAVVGEGDYVDGDQRHLSVSTSQGSISVSPLFSRDETFEPVPGLRIPLTTRELSRETDFDAYRSLMTYHYRDDVGFGRRAILLMLSRETTMPSAIGFIEISTCFMNLQNRTALFSARFAEPCTDITWNDWDLATRTKFTNVVARISRLVVHPEVRGLGFSSLLVKRAADFCTERWHVAGRRPLFMEITADMLTFMPFVEAAGMRFIGESPGNVGRFQKDMRYLYGVMGRVSPDEGVAKQDHAVLGGKGKGILGRQRRDILALMTLKDKIAPHMLFEDFLARSMEDINEPATFEALLPLIRLPKPTYMMGLTKHADAFVRQRTHELVLTTPNTKSLNIAPASGPLSIRDVDVSFSLDTGHLPQSSAATVRRAFGLNRRFTYHTGLRKISFDVQPAQIYYIYGPSGSGKTTLLRMLATGELQGTNVTVSGTVHIPADGRISTGMDPFPGGLLADTIGASTFGQAITALNAAGLAEPRLYLSSFEELSAGQQYRARLARLLCSSANIWILDEFASGLDDATMIAVGRNFARAVRRREVICVVAGIRRYPLVNALSPDVVVQLDQLMGPRMFKDWRAWLGGKKDE